MTNAALPADKTLLLVDDDKPFLTRLARAMETRGFEVLTAESVAEGVAQVKRAAPSFAVVDLRLSDGNGLDVIEALHQARPDARAVVLTGYGNIATAVTAVKLGAIDYLAKPADADAVYGLCNRNVSETARRLNMHRRTLQRILAKRAPK
jgi:two-component system response regulator RegA